MGSSISIRCLKHVAGHATSDNRPPAVTEGGDDVRSVRAAAHQAKCPSLPATSMRSR